MRSVLASLSIEAGALVVAVVSGLLSVPLSFIPLPGVRWACLATTPILMAYLLYWMPVWCGANSSEYSAWLLLFMVVWGGVGLVASASVGVFADRLRRKRSRTARPPTQDKDRRP
jgi:hypothetical protein